MTSYKQNKWLYSSAALLMIALLFYFSCNRSKPSSLDKGETIRASVQDLIQKVTISGRVEPIRSTAITAPYEGYIRKLYVNVGQTVKKGDPLVSLSQSPEGDDNVFPIRAPFSGTIVSVLKTEGQNIKANSQDNDYILRIDDLSSLYVHANAPEIEITKITIAQTAIIKSSAIQTKSYNGKVESIALAPSTENSMSSRWSGGNSQVLYFIKIKIDNPDVDLKSGMSTLVDIITNKKEKVLTLPHEYVFKDNDDYFVLTNSNEKKLITVGLQNDSLMEITSGITEAESVKLIDFLSLVNK